MDMLYLIFKQSSSMVCLIIMRSCFVWKTEHVKSKILFILTYVIWDCFFLAHRIRISEILPWDRKSYLTHAILPRHLFAILMPNGDPLDGFFYPTLTLMIDSYILYKWSTWFFLPGRVDTILDLVWLGVFSNMLVIGGLSIIISLPMSETTVIY